MLRRRIGQARHHDLERRAVGKAQRLERGKSARRTGQQHLAVAREEARAQAHAPLERRHDRQVEFLGEHLLGEHAAVALDDAQLHVGMFAHVVAQRVRQARPGEGRHQADAQRAGDAIGERAHLLGAGLDGAERLDAAAVVAQAGRRCPHPGGGALEQPHPEGAFERRDVLRDARLGGVFARGRPGERALLAHRHHRPDLPQADFRH
jgi:hypothetical protein